MISRPLNSALRSYARSKWDRMKPWRDFNPCFVETTLLCLECICLCTGEWKCNPVPSFEIYKYSSFGNVSYTKRSIAYALSYTALFLGDLQPVLKPSSLEPCDSLVKAEHIISVLQTGTVTQLGNLQQTWNETQTCACNSKLSLPLCPVQLHKPAATQMFTTPTHSSSQWSPLLDSQVFPMLYFNTLRLWTE